ncbi:MAG: GNAT family N-acetyltransferase [Candidatus Obscuribacterales bacterium]|nr:GNAT family N-acetyltransferase [Candidatus Obscuribacterales bacterium]
MNQAPDKQDRSNPKAYEHQKTKFHTSIIDDAPVKMPLQSLKDLFAGRLIMDEKRLIMLRSTRRAADTQVQDQSLAPLRVRELAAFDHQLLGKLFFSAYSGTVDDDGSSEDEFIEEAAATLDGKYGQMIWDASYIVLDKDRKKAVAASVVTDYQRLRPLLAYSATDPAFQRRGLASTTINQSLHMLDKLAFDRMYLVVTEKNLKARLLYEKLGFIISPVQKEKVIIFDEIPSHLIETARQLIQESLANTEAQKQPRLVHLGGIPGSGKTFYAERFLVANPYYALVQFDGIMESLPGYQQDRKNLGIIEAFKRWEMPARAIGYTQLQALLENARNVIFDHGASFESHLGLIGKARAWGYRVEMHYMQCPIEIALRRLQEREQQNLRHTPAQLVSERQDALTKLVPQYRAVTNKFIEIKSYV